MVKKPRIVVLGDLLYDCFVYADRLPKIGETVSGYENGFFSGGKGANQAVQAAKLGAEVYLIGKVGKDSNGDFLLKSLKQYGVNIDYVIEDQSVQTGSCCVHVDREGNNAIIVAALANDKITIEELKKCSNIIRSADVFVTQLQLPQEVVLEGLRIAKNADIISILDPAPAKNLNNEFFLLADYLSPNETESTFYTGIKKSGYDLDEWCIKVAENLHKKGANKVLLTLGSNGFYFDDGKSVFKDGCVPLDTIDTTGAGDSLNGALAFALAKGKSDKEAISFANLVASLTTTKKGSQPAMPELFEVNKFINFKEGENYGKDIFT